MNRLIIASNRLPVKIDRNKEEMKVTASAGGLATGLKSYHKQNNSVWIGWPGVIPETGKEEKEVTQLLEKEHCQPVFLNKALIEIRDRAGRPQVCICFLCDRAAVIEIRVSASGKHQVSAVRFDYSALRSGYFAHIKHRAGLGKGVKPSS